MSLCIMINENAQHIEESFSNLGASLNQLRP